jgi:hypothetical protein
MYLKASGAQRDLESCRSDARLCQLRDMVGVTYLEASRKNYGLAAEHSKRFFDQLSDTAAQVQDPALKGRLDDLLNARDAITAGLAKGDPGVLNNLQALALQTYEGAKR